MRPISTPDDLAASLDALDALDPRLAAVRAAVTRAGGAVPLRRTAPGLTSLVSIVVGQQVSRASAEAILGRFVRLLDPLTPDAILRAEEEVFRQAGFSRPKQRAVLALAAAVRDGLDLEALCALDAGEAIAALTAVAGIGPWTAQCYLLFAAGHPDVFPAKDVALQSAVGHAFGMERRPGDRALAAMAESWAPHRATAARLLWAYYAHMRGRDGAPPVELREKG
jgi:DNA-3-methyladenine glycosylase II